MNLRLLGILMLLLALPASPAGTRLKDLVSIEGVRDNQLVGYGLVVGLNGTGDKVQTVFSTQSLTNLLARMGVQINPTLILVKNIAAVLVTANLPPFAQPGTRIDITVAAIGDASNLQGGLLILTALKAADGQVYAAAQGSVVTAGRVPNGAIIEKLAPSIAPEGRVRLQLRLADFTNAGRVSLAINQRFGREGIDLARAENSALISVDIPAAYKGKGVEFLGELENLIVETDRPARIVVNERTGTIVMGKDVRIEPVAILQGDLTVEIQTSLLTSQPEPLSNGQTTVTPQVNVKAKEEKARNVILKHGASVE